MSRQVINLRAEGGRRYAAPVEVVAACIERLDLWPGDRILVEATEEKGALELAGTGEWIVRNEGGEEVDRGSLP